jgi:hypothetical protein
MALHERDQADPWHPHTRPDRVHYDTGVLLDAQDFRDEQTYHRGRLARALAYLGGSGTLVGLRASAQRPAPGPELQVAGGLAVDRLGRLIEVPRPWCLRLGPWLAAQTDDALRAALGPQGVVADLYLLYVARARGATPSFAHGAFDATDALSPARVRDAFRFTLRLRPEAAADPAAPQFLPAARFAALREVAPAERPAALREALLDGWTDALARPDGGALPPLREHGPDVDPASVFIARVRLPAVDDGPRPAVDLDTLSDTHVDNHARSFVLPSDLTAALLAA